MAEASLHDPVTSWSHVIAVVVALTAVVTLLLLAFAWPASELGPRDLPIAVTGSQRVVEQTRAELARAAGQDAFDVRTVASRAEAVGAIESRDVYGAIVIGPDSAEIVTASAAGPVVSQLLTQISAGIAAEAPPGTPAPTVTDVVPLPADDPRGSGFAAGALPLLIAGIASGAIVALTVRGKTRRALTVTGLTAASGLALSAVLQYALGILPGNYLANAGALGLGLAAVAGTVVGLQNLLGSPGIGVGALLVMVVGNPLSGVTSAPELLPRGWGALGHWLPPGALGTALRSTAYFDGAASTRPLLILAGWVLAGFTMLAATTRRPQGARGGEATRPDHRDTVMS